MKAADMDIPKMYMCCGMQAVYDACVSFKDYLAQEGVSRSYVESDGVHNIPYWDGQMEACFAFLKEA